MGDEAEQAARLPQFKVSLLFILNLDDLPLISLLNCFGFAVLR